MGAMAHWAVATTVRATGHSPPEAMAGPGGGEGFINPNRRLALRLALGIPEGGLGQDA